MKINKLFVAAVAAGMMFASCSSSEEVNDEKGSGAATETYLGFNVKMMSQTRAADQTGTADEKLVTSLDIYVWDTSTQTMDYATFKVLTSFNESSLVYSPKTEDVTVKTTVGTKNVMVVANVTDAMRSKILLAKGAIFTQASFNALVSEFAPVATVGMPMSGYKLSHNLGEQTKAQAFAAPVEISIKRNVAKIVVREGATMNVLGGTTTLSYRLIAEPNASQFGAQTTTLYYTAPAAPAAAADPYFSNFTSRYGYTNATTDFIPVEDYVAATEFSEEGYYCFEHLPSAYYNGNTTSVLVRGVFTPTDIVSTYTPGVTPTTVTNASPAGTDFYKDKTLGLYWSKAAYDAATNATTGDRSNTDFQLFTGGVGYYDFPVVINDATRDDLKAVERNMFYVFDITEVVGPGHPYQPGDPTDTDPKPGDGDEEPIQNDTFISAKVTVLNWAFSTSTVIIQ